jgi:transcriptional regulator with XRE-family HTH domain
LASVHDGGTAEGFVFAIAPIRLRLCRNVTGETSVPKKQANAVDAHVGGRVRARRAMLGLSQERLGELLGITFQQIQKYERGANRISAGRLFEIARILDVSVPYFYEGLAEEKPRRSYGFAEDEVPAPTPPPKENRAAAEGRQLLTAFSQISDAKARRQILDLAKGLAAKHKRKAR